MLQLVFIVLVGAGLLWFVYSTEKLNNKKVFILLNVLVFALLFIDTLFSVDKDFVKYLLTFFFVFLLYLVFLVGDKIVRRMHSQYYEEWELAGRPRGLFWTPKDGNWHDDMFFFKRNGILSDGLFLNPLWAEDKNTIFLFWLYRLCVICLLSLAGYYAFRY